MKLFIISLLIVAAVADSLDNTYLPPGSARSAGGNVNFLNAPTGGSQGGFGGQSPSGNYGAPGFGPSTEYGAPSAEYGAPNNQHSSRNNYNAASGKFGGLAQSREAGAAILRYNNENNGDGIYRFEYETENGISQQESGELKNAGSDYESSSVQGSYTYTGDDGQTYTVNYIADENGFQPFGEHIAEISQAVQTSLQRNAAEAQQGYQYNGQGSSRSQGNGFQSGGSNAANRQYLAPSQQSGYQY